MAIYGEVTEATERRGDAIGYGVCGHGTRGVLEAGQYSGPHSRVRSTCPAREGEASEVGRIGCQTEYGIVIELRAVDDMQPS